MTVNCPKCKKVNKVDILSVKMVPFYAGYHCSCGYKREYTLTLIEKLRFGILTILIVIVPFSALFYLIASTHNYFYLFVAAPIIILFCYIDNILLNKFCSIKLFGKTHDS